MTAQPKEIATKPAADVKSVADKPTSNGASGSVHRTELRVYLPIDGLQSQFAAYLATPTRARGYPPQRGDFALIVEIAPALAIHRVIDVALRAAPEVDPGLLYVERQYGILEVHSKQVEHVRRAGEAILRSIGAAPGDQLKPTVLYYDVIDDIGDQHAVIQNRNRDASMLLPGMSMLVVEMAPALFAAVAANSAERASAKLTLVDVQMIGASGRVFIAGPPEEVRIAGEEIIAVLQSLEGR